MNPEGNVNIGCVNIVGNYIISSVIQGEKRGIERERADIGNWKLSRPKIFAKSFSIAHNNVVNAVVDNMKIFFIKF